MPNVTDIICIRFLLMKNRPNCSECESISSEVINETIAIKKIHRLKSKKENGKNINQPSTMRYQNSIFCKSKEILLLLITTDFPVVLAKAQAIALTKGHPTDNTLVKSCSFE